MSAEIPTWLHQSDLWLNTYPDGAVSTGNTADDSGNPSANFSSLPVCEIDCASASRLYIVMGAWCMAWVNVPKPVFLPLWWKLPEKERIALLAAYTYYAWELHPMLSLSRMMERDEVDSLELYIATFPIVGGCHVVFEMIVARGAIRCLGWWVTRCGGIRHLSQSYGRLGATCVCIIAGQLECLIYCHSHGGNLPSCACAIAAEYGHLDCLKYVHTHGCQLEDPTTVLNAIRNNHLPCVEYLIQHGCLIDYTALSTAATYGRLDCIKYLHNVGCGWGDMAYPNAAESGHFDCMQYLCEHYPVKEIAQYIACNRAAAGGHLQCVQYAHEHGAILDNVCALAAEYGHMNCLTYAHEHGAPWNNACALAAVGGHLECLRYAHEHGAPWNNACEMAAKNGHLGCLAYAHEHGAPWGNTYDMAAWNGNLKCITYAHEHGARSRRTVPDTPSALPPLRL